jgi:hypothetical protein
MRPLLILTILLSVAPVSLPRADARPALAQAAGRPSPSRRVGEQSARRLVGSVAASWLKIVVVVIIITFVWFFLKSRVGR